MKNIIVYLQKSDKKDKKFKVTIVRDSERNKTVHFGASGYSDYTKHKDKELGGILKKEKNINAEIYSGLWDDIGTPERLNAARQTISL